MQVTISVGGKFHAFNLALQLLKQGVLYKLITSFPKSETAKCGLPKNKVDCVLIKEILERSWSKLPYFLKSFYNPQIFIHDLYDKLASKKVTPSDIFVGWSGFALRTIRILKAQGVITIVERGSSHIEYQNDILRDEYEKWGIKTKPFQLPHPKIIEKELREYEEADYISIPSSFVKKTFLEKGISETKLIQIPYGVDLSAFRQIQKNDAVFRVIFAGSITLRKGVHYLLQAFSELNFKDSELLLIGSITDEMKPFFKKYEGKYKWIGPIPQNELYKYYSHGSVFVIMSIEEGLALVQPQAMACGLPVICTTNTGGDVIIRDGVDGFIIPIRDIDALKEKLLFLYENPEICKEMGQSAKERVSRGFTWDDYGNKYVNFLKTIQNKRVTK